MLRRFTMYEEAVITLSIVFVAIIIEAILSSKIESSVNRTRRAVDINQEILLDSRWAQLCVGRPLYLNGLIVLTSAIPPFLCLWIWLLCFTPTLTSIYVAIGLSIVYILVIALNSVHKFGNDS